MHSVGELVICLVRGKKKRGKRSRCHPSGWCATKSIEGRTVRWQNWLKHTCKRLQMGWSGVQASWREQQSTPAFIWQFFPSSSEVSEAGCRASLHLDSSRWLSWKIKLFSGFWTNYLIFRACAIHHSLGCLITLLSSNRRDSIGPVELCTLSFAVFAFFARHRWY